MSGSPAPALEIRASRHFTAWLAATRIGLAFTTYQTGKLFLLGLQPDGRLSVFERTFNRAMGLAVQDTPDAGRQLYLSTLFQLWRFDDALAHGQRHQGYDRLFVPQLAWTTGDIDIHDVAVLEDGTPVFVNTLFSCLAVPAVETSFRPLWQPPFVSRLAAEDRCHLNGLAMRAGRPAFVTANRPGREHQHRRAQRFAPCPDIAVYRVLQMRVIDADCLIVEHVGLHTRLALGDRLNEDRKIPGDHKRGTLSCSRITPSILASPLPPDNVPG